MLALAVTHSLKNYRKLSISRYCVQLKRGNAQSIEVSHTHHSKPYQHSIQLTKTSSNYGNHRY